MKLKIDVITVANKKEFVLYKYNNGSPHIYFLYNSNTDKVLKTYTGSMLQDTIDMFEKDVKSLVLCSRCDEVGFPYEIDFVLTATTTGKDCIEVSNDFVTKTLCPSCMRTVMGAIRDYLYEEADPLTELACDRAQIK